MPKNQQDAEDLNSLGSVFSNPKYTAAHEEMMNEAAFTLSKRRNRLADLYTNATSFEDLGFGQKELVDYVIKLEDAVPLTRGDIKRMSWEI